MLICQQPVSCRKLQLQPRPLMELKAPQDAAPQDAAPGDQGLFALSLPGKGPGGLRPLRFMDHDASAKMWQPFGKQAISP